MAKPRAQVNPLKSLRELPKVHFSWPLPPEFLDGGAGFLDGAVHDYVRITGSCALLLADTRHESGYIRLSLLEKSYCI
jgi:hypothetical protein